VATPALQDELLRCLPCQLWWLPRLSGVVSAAAAWLCLKYPSALAIQHFHFSCPGSIHPSSFVASAASESSFEGY